MPCQDDSYAKPDEAKKGRMIFYMGYDLGDIAVSPSDSNTTDNLEDSVTPPVITPHTSSQSSVTTGSAASLPPTSSEDDLLIPLYLFHVVERTSLNIEFNRCLQLSLLHINENYGKSSKNDETGEGTSADKAGPSADNVDKSSDSSDDSDTNAPVIQLDSEAFDVLLDKIYTYIDLLDDPVVLMELVLRHLYQIEVERYESEIIIPEWLFEEDEIIIPSYLFEESEENELIIPPYLFEEVEDRGMPPTRIPFLDEETFQQDEIQEIFWTKGDPTDIEGLVSMIAKCKFD